MKHIAHPVVGDATHGKGVHNRFFRHEFGCHRLLLACVALRFRHPSTGDPLTIRAPLGDRFAEICRRFGWGHVAVPDTPT